MHTCFIAISPSTLWPSFTPSYNWSAAWDGGLWVLTSTFLCFHGPFLTLRCDFWLIYFSIFLPTFSFPDLICYCSERLLTYLKLCYSVRHRLFSKMLSESQVHKIECMSSVTCLVRCLLAFSLVLMVSRKFKRASKSLIVAFLPCGAVTLRIFDVFIFPPILHYC